jgi:hypothetical protein
MKHLFGVRIMSLEAMQKFQIERRFFHVPLRSPL